METRRKISDWLAANLSYCRLVRFIFFLSVFLLFSCEERIEKEKLPHFKIEEIPSTVLNNMSKKRIYYGHQSVGNMIALGLKNYVNKYSQIKLPVMRSSEVVDDHQKGFFHSRISGDPKIIPLEYDTILKGIPGRNIDVALIRVDPFTNIKGMDDFMNDYASMMWELKKKYPETKFIHITYPLLSPEPNSTNTLKIFLGNKDFRQYSANIVINDFNDRLRSAYKGSEPLFDIAKVLSTQPDGRRSVFYVDGRKYYKLYREYTYDGSHLTQKGMDVIGEQFLIYLAKLI